jgi:hypothetical protein
MNLKFSVYIEVASSDFRRDKVASSREASIRPPFPPHLTARLLALAARLVSWTGLSGWF